jgi:hypothetical protein
VTDIALIAKPVLITGRHTDRQTDETTAEIDDRDSTHLVGFREEIRQNVRLLCGNAQDIQHERPRTATSTLVVMSDTKVRRDEVPLVKVKIEKRKKRERGIETETKKETEEKTVERREK